MTETRDVAPDRLRLSFRDGGWVIALALTLCAALLLWAFAGVLLGHRPIGGGDVASYRFDLSTAPIPQSEFTASGYPRDFLRVLIPTGSMPGAEVEDFNARHKRYLVSGDRIVGVTLSGERRAYPLSVLAAHEAVEDTLAGVPILVTYSPLCDAVAVYDRRLGGETLSFGVSGLLRNANTLYFDRRPTEGSADSSLWQQIDGRAVAGPAAARGDQLTPIASISVERWADWLAAHPETTVVLRDEGRVRLYRNISYDRAHQRPEIGLPVATMPAPESWPPKERVFVVDAPSGRRVLSARSVAAAGDQGVVVKLPEGTFVIRTHGDERTFEVLDGGLPASVRILPCFWFAAVANLGATDAERIDPL